MTKGTGAAARRRAGARGGRRRGRRGAPWPALALGWGVLLACLAPAALAQPGDDEQDTQPEPVVEATANGFPADEKLPGLPVAPLLSAVGAADTVRTNLWLARALLTESILRAAACLPPPPQVVVLRPRSGSSVHPFYQSIAFKLLTERGYALYLDEGMLAPKQGKPPPPANLPATGVTWNFQCEDVSLSYPAMGRRFGLWRQWLDREVHAAVDVSLVDRETGRLLLDERYVRTFADRVPAGEIAGIQGPRVAFLDAPIQETGWRRWLEGTVVVGALAGLVAIYFANTGS